MFFIRFVSELDVQLGIADIFHPPFDSLQAPVSPVRAGPPGFFHPARPFPGEKCAA
jgi:hypothetical protein